MGCIQSKREDKYRVSSPAGAEEPSPQGEGTAPKKQTSAAPASGGQIKNYAGPRPKLDPKDFQFVGLKGETRVKAPGSINGQAFMIDRCEDCDLYILDHCAQVTIDECKNCRIFIGPTDGSIFLRDSRNVKCAFITRQLRTRDVVSADILLLCRTRPIIESSTNIGLSCYNFNFPALPGLMKSAKLDVLHNFWSYVYDFTPKPDNWHYLPAETTMESLLGPLPAEVTEVLGSPCGAEGPLIPLWGDRSQPSPDYMFVVFPHAKLDSALQFINQAKHQAVVLRTNCAEVPPDTAQQMVAVAGWARAVERDLISGKCVGVEVSGEGAHALLNAAAHMLGGHGTEHEEVGSLFRCLGIDG